MVYQFNYPMKKTIKFRYLLLLVVTLASVTNLKSEEIESGVYKTKEDFINKKITPIGKILPSENYNIGLLSVMQKDKDIVKVNCLHEQYWGFKYIDGNDYMLVDGVYARIVILGRINLLISPKADYKKTENEGYVFTPAPNGKLNFYFVKGLDNSKPDAFEKLIDDEKTVLKAFQKDRDNYGEFINKQIKYLEIYNATIPKPVKAKGRK
jgi:hypothetical protein